MNLKKIGLLTVLLGSSALAGTASALDIKIGVLNDRSGTFADLSGEGSAIAARMAVEDFDAVAKGLNVEIITGDHQNKPDIGSSIAREWYDRDGVDVIVDVPTSSVALAVNDISRDSNKVFLNSGAASSLLTGANCTANTIHWVYDTWALSHGTASALVARGGDKWFFMTADYTFGHTLEAETGQVVVDSGGEVIGSVRHPFINQDFSSYLLQAQASGANVIGLANSGADAVNTITQAREFGIAQGGQTLAGLLLMLSEVHALGVETAQGLVLTEAFYWDLNDETRKWSERFAERHGGKMPTMVQAGVYSSIMHYLKAAEQLNNVDNGAAVVAAMKAMPTDDVLFGKGEIRADGRKLHPTYLFEVKTPEQSKGEWDLYNLLATIPPEQAFRPMNAEECSLVP